MPQMRVRGIELNGLCKISDELIDLVTETAGVDEKYVKIEYFPAQMIRKGTVVESYPNIDIFWFPRTQELRDKVAQAITDFLQGKGYEFVQVTFTEHEGYTFFENAKHY